jgi:ADP-heptose:LPS heptosyltransferase
MRLTCAKCGTDRGTVLRTDMPPCACGSSGVVSEPCVQGLPGFQGQPGETTILIFPWARNTTEGKPSPKNYPFWDAVVTKLLKKGHKVHQVSCSGEPDVPGCTMRSNDLPLSKITELLGACDTWASVDSFLPHLAWSIGKRGVAIFGLSDPEIFGHRENINLLRGRRFLRVRQFGLWSQETYNSDAFVQADQVVNSITLLLSAKKW